MRTPLLFLLLTVLGAAPALAAPLDVSADKSIEWNRKQKTYTARGKAVATQGSFSVAADTLTAYYGGKTQTDITRIEAEGAVTLSNAPYTAYGDRAAYDLATGIATLTGQNLRIETATEKLTATRDITFDDRAGRITATGSPTLTRGTDKLTAATLYATLATGKDGKRQITQLVAEGGVTITTARDTVTGTRGVYDIQAGKATITGPITIKQGDSVIEGSRAEVDLTTGRATLFADASPAAPGGKKRVKGVFYPSQPAGQP